MIAARHAHPLFMAGLDARVQLHKIFRRRQRIVHAMHDQCRHAQQGRIEGIVIGEAAQIGLDRIGCQRLLDVSSNRFVTDRGGNDKVAGGGLRCIYFPCELQVSIILRVLGIRVMPISKQRERRNAIRAPLCREL